MKMKKMLSILIALMIMCTGFAMAETLKMGSCIDFAPYEYYDDATGDIVGIDVEIAYAVAEKLGCELEIVDMQFDSIIAAVVSGKVDFGMSGFTVTEERKQNVDFSSTYTTAVQSIIVPEGSAITSVDDLFNAENAFNIGVQIGTTGDLYISGDVEANGLKHSVERFNKYHDAFAALASGKIDCIIVDDQVGIAYVNANEGMKILDTAYAFEEYAICFAKESDLFAPFDAALQELIADGTVQAIIDKYIAG
ncbi:MAG: transporter substrate-binding domain-containing protein [Clostridia bacterium]|nr:transporter substrate-binding domain-containing protein [Clostridia bacterium]